MLVRCPFRRDPNASLPRPAQPACEGARVDVEGAPRTAVLLDYPLRLWARQQEHTDGLLREFKLLLIGERSGELESQPPGQLVALANMFDSRFGPLLDAITRERQEALDAGRDRVDSRIPLVDGTPQLLAQVRAVMAAVDDYCRDGDMLLLPRSPELLALADWTHQQIVGQYDGAEPTPWPGPF